MRKSLRNSFLLLGTTFIATLVQSQADRFAYAITDVQKNGANWSYLRKMNLQTGEFSDVILNGNDVKQVAYDAGSHKEITSFVNEAHRGFNTRPAFSSGVAALAYDRKNERIWYTPMFIDQLRYIDLKTMKVYYVTAAPLTGMAQKSADQGNIVTRMTIGNDGYGYALTNDGEHLIRFSTGKKITITDLGRLADDAAGSGVSIHSSCTSFGGDMVADNEGNLLVFSARNHVFKVNIESKVATHQGTITGLPENFTANGAAVTIDNQVVISSATSDNGYYMVDASNWTSALYNVADGWRTSDLANSNILSVKKLLAVAGYETTGHIIPSGNDIVNGEVQVFPNPVTDGQFSVQFGKLEPGEYTIQLTDVTGRQVLQRIVNVAGKGQVETIRLNASNAKGFYLVKIMNKQSRTVMSSKIIVQ